MTRQIDYVRCAGWTPDAVGRAVRRFAVAPCDNPDDAALAQELLRWLVSADPQRLASSMEELRPESEPVSAARALGSARMQRGVVKRFDDAKGYGFLSREEDGRDVFVHYSAILTVGFRTLRIGQLVLYEELDGPKGLYAVRVLLETSASSAPSSRSIGEAPSSRSIGEGDPEYQGASE
jgi:CspA family cold shock protein